MTRLTAFGPLMDWHQGRCYKAGNAEIRPVREAGYKSGNHDPRVVRRQSTCQIPCRIKGHQPDQQLAPEKAGSDHGQQRRAHDNPQRIGADQMSYLWFRDAEILRHIGHQTHDGEFTGTDGKSTKRQCEFNQENPESCGWFAAQKALPGAGLKSKTGNSHLYRNEMPYELSQWGGSQALTCLIYRNCAAPGACNFAASVNYR